MKAIEIDFLRISPDGEALEFKFNCPDKYYFTEFRIRINDNLTEYSIAESLFTEELCEYSGAIALSSFGVVEPAIYTINLRAALREDIVSDEDEVLDPCKHDPRVLHQEVIISDVHHVYECLINDILNLDAQACDSTKMDEIIRHYLILYGHHEAMAHHSFDDAKRLFDKMKNCFHGCNNHKRSGCAACGDPTPVNYSNSCGCKR